MFRFEAPAPRFAADVHCAAAGTPVDSDTRGTVCGFPSHTVTFRHQRVATTAKALAARDTANRIWVRSVTAQTTAPDDPDFVRDQQAMLDGVQITPR